MFVNRIRHLFVDDLGMSSVEYALGTMAAAALAGVLYTIVTGDSVTSALEGMFTDALHNRP
ncbi:MULTISPECIES: DUF4244 domain-containing protein [Corynebacterium]|uniref:DUF4244 domain-containing protein n=2 Tax=Corynebacterium glucuronolyticum TaxID=39791 RepID=A0A7T4EFS3_9CORY|nr:MULTISPECIES: DUF4244 domain-containing protein [Corynebacterium]EEI28224.1 hypothetical protein HMPREF0294_0404 [Corynebacterium glucuronolyticum ATCC 51867]EEI63519.1 hypothetical protein HMPREF0293_0898 [Corynebacterium glucuronolyticum ATCC 51866]MCT1443227.1 DUF4244 domain-containing protein [Corynebacterium glucuronolyticum]MCT1563346.1 DUF4244 domain-containing protein [Corynebacterium glucuronolyticum]OFO43923.1 hypothetical protein HMPREF3044_12135 [Corynebacterium sp. HMSC073D01]